MLRVALATAQLTFVGRPESATSLLSPRAKDVPLPPNGILYYPLLTAATVLLLSASLKANMALQLSGSSLLIALP